MSKAFRMLGIECQPPVEAMKVRFANDCRSSARSSSSSVLKPPRSLRSVRTKTGKRRPASCVELSGKPLSSRLSSVSPSKQKRHTLVLNVRADQTRIKCSRSVRRADLGTSIASAKTKPRLRSMSSTTSKRCLSSWSSALARMSSDVLAAHVPDSAYFTPVGEQSRTSICSPSELRSRHSTRHSRGDLRTLATQGDDALAVRNVQGSFTMPRQCDLLPDSGKAAQGRLSQTFFFDDDETTPAAEPVTKTPTPPPTPPPQALQTFHEPPKAPKIKGHASFSVPPTPFTSRASSVRSIPSINSHVTDVLSTPRLSTRRARPASLVYVPYSSIPTSSETSPSMVTTPRSLRTPVSTTFSERVLTPTGDGLYTHVTYAEAQMLLRVRKRRLAMQEDYFDDADVQALEEELEDMQRPFMHGTGQRA